ncbi:sarcalumenin isoform X2 [Odontomachus brunneus]|uniref:sarcalumenin isoform X2 n=1 Tax=Odontomachus brunneus TaxID=486640 RepID=UPI0013F28F18|nr:sarcalumenin isoform X2 [Odontomachus brunneus]
MTVARMRPALVAGLFLSLLAVALQGVLSEEELDKVPSEDLCRPYIEKALKGLGTGSLEQTSAEVGVGVEVDQESREETRVASEEVLADEAANDVSEEVDEIKDEEDTVEQSIEAAEADESKEATEEQVDTSEEKVEGKSEKDEGGQSDEAETTESAEISTAREEEIEEAADTPAGIAEEEQTDSPEKITESEEGSDQATAEEEDEKPDEEKSDEEAKVEDEKSEEEEEKADDETKSEEEKDETEEESRIEEEEGQQEESEEATEEVALESKEEAESEQASTEVSVEAEGAEEDAVSIEDRTLSGESKQDSVEEEAQTESAEAESEIEERASEETTEVTGSEDIEESAKSAEAEDEEEEDKGEEEEEEARTMSAEEEEEKSAEDEKKSTEDEEKEAKSEEEEAKCDKDDAECERSAEQGSQGKSKAEKSEEEEDKEDEEETEGKSEEEGAKSEEEEEDRHVKSRGRRQVDEEDTKVTGESMEEAISEEEEEKEEEREQEPTPEEDLIQDIEIPENLRPRDHINQLLKLDEENEQKERATQRMADIILRDLKRLYDNAIQPLETMYKYRDLSNRHFGDPEIFSKPLVLFMGPWSGGKSSIINYLLDIEYKPMSLRTGAEPSPAYFNIIMHGEEEEILDGTQLAADWTFSGLQKFGQGMLDRLRGLRLNNKLLEKVNIVEIPGILEIRKQVQRLFPFNDACQWFIDRADIIFLVYDPAKLDVGPETEAILDQLKGREYQTRIILNKADQVKPEELMRVQGALIWNISPLMSSAEPPIMYSTSLWSLPYEAGAPTRLLYAQERAFLRDLRTAINKRVEHKIASARRFAVRVRNHAKMVDCYLTTYYNHKTFFGDKRQISDKIIENPQDYHIYEGLSTLTNISRYDLPDPDVYRDFFRLNALYDFPLLSSTCTYFRGCPINRLDVAIAYDLPELVGKYKKSVEAVLHENESNNSPTS